MGVLIPLKDRFWRKVRVAGPDDCWEWTGATHEGGYGAVKADRASAAERPRNIGTHRAAWSLTFGPIPDGIDVCHSCDNPPCCNPAHLFLGTRKDNLTDAIAKKRFGRFQRHHAEVKRLAAAGVDSRQIAARFGMSRSNVYGIVRGRFDREHTCR